MGWPSTPIFVSGLIAFTPVVFVCVAVWLLQLCAGSWVSSSRSVPSAVDLSTK